jgi:tetratricopeptide (TPR) repeat protein
MHQPAILLPSLISRIGQSRLIRGIALLAILAAWILPAPAHGQSESMPRSEREALYRAQKHLSSNSTDKCLSTLRKYRETHGDPQSALFYLFLGNAHYSRQDYSRAEQAYSRGLKKNSDHPTLLRNLASVCLQNGKALKAGRYYRRAFEATDEPKPELLYQAGAAFYRAEAFDRALSALNELFDRAEEIQPAWAELLVSTCLESEQWARAKAVLDRLLEKHPEQRRYWRLLAQVRLKREEYRKAACALEIAYKLEPPEPAGWKDLANIYASIHAPLQAARALERACGDSCSIKELRRLSRLYSRACRYEQAISCLDRALEHSASAALYLEKGRFCYRAGRFERARSALRKSLELAPDRHEASLWLGYTAWQLRDWDLAKRCFARVPDDTDVGQQAQNGLQSVLAVLEANTASSTMARKGG